MSRIYDYTLVGVVSIITFTIHRIAIGLFAPESSLHELASEGTAFDGAARADLWFEIIAVWAPLIVIAGVVVWAFLREWRRQVTTARAPPR